MKANKIELDEFDKYTAFPTLITQLIREDREEPIVDALRHLPEQSQLNVLRQLETAIHRETLEMDNKTFETFLSDLGSRASTIRVTPKVEITLETTDDFDSHCYGIQGGFKDIDLAADYLYKWIHTYKRLYFQEKHFENEKDTFGKLCPVIVINTDRENGISITQEMCKRWIIDQSMIYRIHSFTEHVCIISIRVNEDNENE
jgi:hypothetical protein